MMGVVGGEGGADHPMFGDIAVDRRNNEVIYQRIQQMDGSYLESGFPLLRPCDTLMTNSVDNDTIKKLQMTPTGKNAH